MVADVLARPEYAESRPGWWDRLWAVVLQVVGDVVALLQSGGAGSVIGTAVLVLATVAVLVAVVRFTRRVQRGARREIPEVHGGGRSSAQWRALAEDHQGEGRRREAVRCLYRALIARLAETGLLGEVPGRTAGEYLAAVRTDLPAAADPFAAATAAFERAWYGRAAVTEADVRGMEGEIRAVEDALGLRPVPSGAAT